MAALPRTKFGRTPEGTEATLHTLRNDHLHVCITDFGGRMVSIAAPDRKRAFAHVLLGFDDVGRFATAGGSFGALLGRTANRIAVASFTLDGQTYRLVANEGDATLHGGKPGFGNLFWQVADLQDGARPTLVLAHTSPDGDQGFPGTLQARATYRLDGDTLTLTLEATTDKPTIVNLSAHPYFNLAGVEQSDVLGHEAMIASDAILPTDARQIPTGEVRDVSGTVFDFRQPTPLGARIRQADEQLLHGLGYDCCFVLQGGDAGRPRLAIRLREPRSGRVLEVLTTQRGLQVYTGNKLNGSIVGRGGIAYRQSAGIALEGQGFPDAPHHPDFPSIVLRPGETYREVIAYRFTTD